MPITEHQREQRTKHIGGSDMPAIVGLDPYRSAYDVWLDKTGRLEDIDEPTDAMIAGTYLEVGVLDWAEGELGKLRRNQYRSNAALHLGTNIDAILIDVDEPIEGKTAGLFGPLVAGWGDDRTDQVPDQVVVQAHVHMLCIDDGATADCCHVPALLGGRGFQMFRVQRSADLCDVIAERAVKFWEAHVLKDIPPDDSVPTLDVAKRMRRTAGKVSQIDPALIVELKAARKAFSDAEERKEQAAGWVMAALGDADAGCGGVEVGSVTYFAQGHRSFDSKRFRVDHPLLGKQYTRSGTHRVLRTKKGILIDGK
jgi:putative phage-type endonuclease